MSYETLIKRIERMKALGDPSSMQVRQALTRIGTVLKAQIRQNLTDERMVDQGHLRQSIEYYVHQNKDRALLEVGSFGIKYAAINEFGGEMSQKQVRAMFAALSRRGKLGQRKHDVPVVTVNKKTGKGIWRKRPFIAPAFKKHSFFIIDVLRSIGKA